VHRSIILFFLRQSGVQSKFVRIPVSELQSVEASSGLSLSLGSSLFGIRSTSTRSWDEKHIDSLVGSAWMGTTLLASSSPTNDDVGISSGDRSALLDGVGVSIGDLSRTGFSMGDLSDRTTPGAAADDAPDGVRIPALSMSAIGPTLGELAPMMSRFLVASRTGDEVPLIILLKFN
jgi:hypothetical protein